MKLLKIPFLFLLPYVVPQAAGSEEQLCCGFAACLLPQTSKAKAVPTQAPKKEMLRKDPSQN